MGLEQQSPLIPVRVPVHEQEQQIIAPPVVRLALGGGNTVDYLNPLKTNFDAALVSRDIEAVTVDTLPTEGVQRVLSGQKQTLEEFSEGFIPYLQELRINPEATRSRWDMLGSFGLHPGSETLEEDVAQFYRNHIDIATVGPSHLEHFAQTFIQHASQLSSGAETPLQAVQQQVQLARFLRAFGQQGEILMGTYIMARAYLEDPTGQEALITQAPRAITVPLPSEQTEAFTQLYESQISIKAESIEREVSDRSTDRSPAKATELVTSVREIFKKQLEDSKTPDGGSKLSSTEKEIKEGPYKDQLIQEGKVLRLVPGGELDVYGDGHGDFESWMTFLREIDYFKKALRGEIKLVLTGDMFDRGRAQVQLFESILKIIQWNHEIGRNTLFVIQGDHDKSGAVTASDYASQFFAGYARQSEKLLELVSGQNANFPIATYIRHKLGIPPDAKNFNGLPVEGKGSIIEFVQNRLIAYMKREQRPEAPKKAIPDQKSYLNGALRTVSSSLAEITGLYRDEFKLCDLFPQVVIDPSGVVIVHGGTAHVESLDDLKNNQDALDETMWGDLSLFTNSSINKTERLVYITELLDRSSGSNPTDMIEYQESVGGLTQTYNIEKQQLEKAKQILENSGSYEFNPERASGEVGQLGAILIHAVLFAQVEAREFLTAVLGEENYGVLARGHEMIEDESVIDQLLAEYHGLVGWVHGAGITRDSKMPSKRYYLHFPNTSEPIKEITKDNVKQLQ